MVWASPLCSKSTFKCDRAVSKRQKVNTSVDMKPFSATNHLLMNAEWNCRHCRHWSYYFNWKIGGWTTLNSLTSCPSIRKMSAALHVQLRFSLQGHQSQALRHPHPPHRCLIKMHRIVFNVSVRRCVLTGKSRVNLLVPALHNQSKVTTFIGYQGSKVAYLQHTKAGIHTHKPFSL